MSAGIVLCGKRSSFEESHLLPSSPSASSLHATSFNSASSSSKRFRLGGISPTPVIHSAASVPSFGVAENLAILRVAFPAMDEQVLQRVLEASDNNIDSAIRSLHSLSLGTSEIDNLATAADHSPVAATVVHGTNDHRQAETDTIISAVAAAAAVAGGGGGSGVGGEAGSSAAPDPSMVLPQAGEEWVELVVREMMSAADVADARSRAANVLETFQKVLLQQASVNVVEPLQKENLALKELVERLQRDCAILKRAVAIQHEKHREAEERNKEVQQMKELLVQYQERLRTLEVNNYALSLHLKTAQDSNSMPSRFHPDIF